VPWDWSPDGKTLLFYTRDDFSKPLRGFILQLDLDSLAATMFLEDPELNLWQAHFSHDGRWVTFNATAGDKSSRIYVVPFRKALLPRSEWIPITNGDWDDKPRFSSDDKLIFFRAGRAGSPRRILSHTLTSGMRPDGNPATVYSFGEKFGESDRLKNDDDLSVGPNLIAFAQIQFADNIWLLEPAKGAK
jgi:Tol biopolymer transport system component